MALPMCARGKGIGSARHVLDLLVPLILMLDEVDVLLLLLLGCAA